MTNKQLQQNLKKLETELADIDDHIDSASNAKLIILFSGIPGSGKTTLAKKIEKEFNGFRISKDEIWANSIQPLFKKDYSIEERNEIADLFFKNKVKEAATKSKLIIVDRNIDRGFEDFKKEFENLNYKVFIINLEIQFEAVIERIENRESSIETAEDYKKNLDRWVKEHEEFIKKFGNEIDFTIHQHAYQFEYPALLNLIFKNLN